MIIEILVKFLILIVMLLSLCVNAQVGINTATPNAQLDIRSGNQAAPANTDGILIPKIDAFPAVNPTTAQNGMMVFLTTDSGTNPSGFYYWDDANAGWISIAQKDGWKTKGNTGTNSGTDFLGTTDNNDVVFKRDGQNAGRIGGTNIAFGLNTNPANAGNHNSVFGIDAMPLNTSGIHDTAIGKAALNNNIGGDFNTAVGSNTLAANQFNNNNTAFGALALQHSTGSNNIGIGYNSGSGVTTGSYNLALGVNAQVPDGTASSQMSIGNVIYGTLMGSPISGKIGIGVTVPLSKLHVMFSASGMVPNPNAVLTLEKNGSSYLNILSGVSETGVLFGTGGISSNGGIIYNNPAVPDGLLFRTNNNINRMIIGSDGNVAIGNFSPIYPLQFPNLIGDKICLYGTGASSYGFGVNHKLFQIHSDVDFSDIGFGYGSHSAFTENMRIKGTGNVGVGITNPLARLHISQGTSGMVPVANTVAAFEKNNDSYLNILAGTGETGLMFGTGGISNNGAVVYNNTSNPNGFNIKGNGNVNKIVITASGNVGLGDFIPNHPLQFPNILGDKIDLYGTTTTYGFGIQSHLLQIHTDDTASDIALGSGNSASFTEKMRIKGTGNVGIGISSPLSELHVFRSASGMTPNPNATLTIEKSGLNYVNLLSDSETGILFGANNFSSDGGIIYNTINPAGVSYVPGGFSFRTTGNVHRMSLTSSGDVGIGNSLPSARLQVYSSNETTPANTDGIIIPKINNFPLTNPTLAQDGIMVYLSATIGAYQSGFYYWDNASVSWLAVGSKSNWSFNGNSGTNPTFNYIGTSDNKDVVVKANSVEIMRATTTGNVGIKTNNPSAELEVNGYTKLGSNAPAIKYLKLIGITSAAQGGVVVIPHGLTTLKILSVSVLVDYASPSCIAPSYTQSAGFEFSYFVTAAGVSVVNKSANSASILSKPIRILIAYEE